MPHNVPRNVLILSDDGSADGISRVLAIATRLGGDLAAVIHARHPQMAALHEAGFCTLFDRLDSRAVEALAGLSARLNPAVVILFSDVLAAPYETFLKRNSTIPRVWVMPGPGVIADAAAQYFDAVIMPGDLSAAATPPQGLTLHVPPILHINPHQRQPRPIARRILGIGLNDRVVALELEPAQAAIAARVRAVLNVLPDLRVIDLHQTALPPYPLSTGFDAVITTAAYQPFHECILGGLPTLFVPPARDDALQHRRIGWATAQGLALTIDQTADDTAIAGQIETLLAPEMAAHIAAQAQVARWTNGALDIAALIRRLATGGA